MSTIFKNKTFKIKALSTAIILSTLSLSACGGGGGGTDKIKEEYDRVEDNVKEQYDKVENKLTDNEKSMSEILESIFLPEESLDKFLDKITPEGGKGGLYAGHFVELNDGDNDDIDIGGVYFDIGKDAAGSVDGRVSYQQDRCQNNKTLATDAAVKIDNYLVGKLSGSLDSLEFLDVKYIRDLDLNTPNILTTFSGKFNENVQGSPWVGSFEYQDGLGGTELSSGKDNCDVSYTLSSRANYSAYPLNYKLGNIEPTLDGIGTKTSLNWTAPANAAITLVSQINVNKAESGANGYEVNEVVLSNEPAMFEPIMTDSPANYAFVIQVFDKDNRLIGYEAIIADLPQAFKHTALSI